MIMNKKQLEDMELHETRSIEEGATPCITTVTRVYNGWVYHFLQTSVFVPQSLDVEAMNDFS